MHKTAGQLTASAEIERAEAPRRRKATSAPSRREPQPIHPSLRALPDYPE